MFFIILFLVYNLPLSFCVEMFLGRLLSLHSRFMRLDHDIRILRSDQVRSEVRDRVRDGLVVDRGRRGSDGLGGLVRQVLLRSAHRDESLVEQDPQKYQKNSADLKSNISNHKSTIKNCNKILKYNTKS